MNRKPKILVVGSFVMDLIATTDRAPKSGQTIVGRDFHIAPGGKGANQAVQCARLGADVTMIGCVGGDIFARELLDTARDAGVHVEHVKIDTSVSSGIGHVLLEVTEHSAQNRITVIPGANQHLYPEDIAWLQPRIQEYDMVLLQMEIPLEINLLVSQWAADAGIPVMLNPAPAAALSDQLLSHVTYLTPNEQEAAVETGLPLHTTDGSISETDLQAIAAALREKGVEHVIITLGGNGSAVVEQTGIHYIPIVKMPHVADRFLCRRAVHRSVRRDDPGAGAVLRQLHRRHHGFPDGRHALSAHAGGGPAADPSARRDLYPRAAAGHSEKIRKACGPLQLQSI